LKKSGIASVHHQDVLTARIRGVHMRKSLNAALASIDLGVVDHVQFQRNEGTGRKCNPGRGFGEGGKSSAG
jgi:hypothetical protein